MRDQEISAEELTDAFKRVFDTPDGKTVLRNICKFGHLMRSTYSNRDRDAAMALVYREGERNVVMYILNRLNATPYDFIKEMYKYE